VSYAVLGLNASYEKPRVQKNVPMCTVTMEEFSGLTRLSDFVRFDIIEIPIAV
jgi:hypothetical protein